MTYLELEDRLRATARHATTGLTIADPTLDGVVVEPTEPPGGRVARRRRVRPRAVVFSATAAAFIGLLAGAVVLRGGPDRLEMRTMDDGGFAAATQDPPSVASTDPAQRLRDAVGVTLASPTYQVRTVAVVAGPGQSIESLPGPSVMPLVFGSGEYGDTVWTVANDLVEVHNTAGPARSIRDLTASTTTWEVAPGEWQRANFAEDTVVEDLRRFAQFSCVQQVDPSDPSRLVVLAGDAPCPADLASEGPRRLRWTVTIRPDGRVASIVPVRDADAVADPRSEQHFDDYGANTILMPDPSSVTEVPAPVGSSIDPETGYARPMYTTG